MKIPPGIVSPLIAALVMAQARGWIEVRNLEPLLKTIVDTGHSGSVRQLLGEVLMLLEKVELQGSKPV
jgi:hypothetical protein